MAIKAMQRKENQGGPWECEEKRKAREQFLKCKRREEFWGSALGREGKRENRKRRRRGVGNQRRGARKGFRRKEQAAFFFGY